MLCTAGAWLLLFYHQLTRLVEQIWTKRVTSLCQPTPTQRFPRWLSGKEFICWCRHCRRCRFNPCMGKDPLEKGIAICSSILPSKSHGPRTWWATVHGLQRVKHNWARPPTQTTDIWAQINYCCLKLKKKNRKKGKIAIIASVLACFEAIKLKVFWEWEKSTTTVVLAWAPKRRNIFTWKYKQFGSFLGGKESSRQCRRRGFDPWSGKIPPGLEQLSPCPTSTGPGAQEPGSHNYGARELQLPKLACSGAQASQQENPLQGEARAPQLENSSRSPKLEKSLRSNETQHSQK